MGEGGRREKGSFISLPHPYPRVESLLTGYIIVYVFALDIKSPVSPTKCSANVPLRYTFPFFGKWNWSVQMLNAISGQNLPVLNFAYHLPKPWTNWYANVDSKQPKFFFYLSYTVLYFYKNNSSSPILSSISLFQACRRALLSLNASPLVFFFFVFPSSIFARALLSERLELSGYHPQELFELLLSAYFLFWKILNLNLPFSRHLP